MKTINEQLDKELFEGYPCLHDLAWIRPRYPLRFSLRWYIKLSVCSDLCDFITNKLYIEWQYGDSITRLK